MASCHFSLNEHEPTRSEHLSEQWVGAVAPRLFGAVHGSIYLSAIGLNSGSGLLVF